MDGGSDIYFKWANVLKSLSLTPKVSSTLSGDIFVLQDTIQMYHHPQQVLIWKASWVTPLQDVTSLCSYSNFNTLFLVPVIAWNFSWVHFMPIFWVLGDGPRIPLTVVSSSTEDGVQPLARAPYALLEKMWLEDRGPCGDVRPSVESALHTQQHLRKQIPSQSTVAGFFFFKPQKEL